MNLTTNFRINVFTSISTFILVALISSNPAQAQNSDRNLDDAYVPPSSSANSAVNSGKLSGPGKAERIYHNSDGTKTLIKPFVENYYTGYEYKLYTSNY